MSDENKENNPYATPNTNVDNQMQARSSIPKVIGIISLVMAGLGIFGALAGLATSFFIPEVLDAQASMGLSKNYLIGTQVASFIISLWAIFIGIKLIKYLDIGRRHFNYYTIISVLMSIVGYFMTKNMMKDMFADMSPEMAKAATEASTLTSLVVFISPIIIIIVAILLNQKRVKDSLS